LNNNIKTAVRYHQAGQFQQAESLYNQILKEDPDHADALHLLGVIARQRGEYDLAVELINKAIAKNSSVFIYHNNLGNAFKAIGRLNDAVECYEEALHLKPDYALAH
jgi:protein O-GlcNAc transferase